MDCHGAATPAFGRSAASHLAGRAGCDNVATDPGSRAADHADDHRCDRYGSWDSVGRGTLDPRVPNRVVDYCSVALYAMGSGRLAAISHHAAVSIGGRSKGE